MTTSNENASLHNQNLSKAIPKLRFKEFNDKWQNEKLKDIAIFKAQKNKKLKFTEVFSNSAKYGVISQKIFLIMKQKLLIRIISMDIILFTIMIFYIILEYLI